MSKDKTYRSLISSARWARLARRLKDERGWQCERCGRVTQRMAVHHVRPMETARSPLEMERLCFDARNLQCLCHACHAETHRLERSHSREKVRQRAAERVERFLSEFTRAGQEGGT